MTDIITFAAHSRIAYFTMEIALRSEMHTYSGGLGVLSGDTARSAADLTLPMVFVSLVSRAGYLHQSFDAQGRQISESDPWEPERWTEPLPAKIAVSIEGREVWVRPWLYRVTSRLGGEVPVILLDTRLDENSENDRSITDRLYGGDPAYRLKQEIVLGIGGVRMLRALDFHSLETFHLNEGHAALLCLALLRRQARREAALRPTESRYDVAAVRRQCVFTTHTPVEAGHDRFSYDLVHSLLGDYLPMDQIRRLAGPDMLNMTTLALELCGYVNGVAVRHAQVSGSMFPEHPVRAITNGVHLGTWASPGLARLFDAQLPPWRHEPEVLVRADLLDDGALWSAHQEVKRALFAAVKERSGVAMDEGVATIGFARRITGYKRPGLLFREPERLRAIAARFPFQLVMAGKTHPHDTSGLQIAEFIHQNIAALDNAIRIVFLPGYDMDLAGLLVAGVDIWLNTPLPPHEASGTSGMKAALNGVLNFSTLDGWWLEGWIEGRTGWAIGDDSGHGESARDAESLYGKLENDILPLYYNDRAGWIALMKQSIAKIAPFFNSHRMMRHYLSEAYVR
jgi:starch phosphorylase